MYRALLERALDPHQLDQLFHDTAQTQRTRERLFSAMVQLMFAVVSKAHPSVRAASFASLDEVMTTLTAVSAKLQGIKPEVCRGYVLHAHDRLEPILRRLDGGTLPRPLPGYRARILDGNHLAGTEHRPAPTRTTRVAALPGQTLVVLDPATMLACDVVPCGDAYAQERSLIDAVLERVAEGDFWIADRNFCCSRSVFGVVARRGHFLVRQHKATLRWEEAGVGGDGRCAEVGDDLPHALDAGERLPDADRGVALRDRHVGLAQGHMRWTLENVFQTLTEALRCEIDTLA